jgi:uncharacterized protein (TIGR02646 family)
MIRIVKPGTGPKSLITKGSAAEKLVCADYDSCPKDYDSGRKTLPKSKSSIYNSRAVKRMLMTAQHRKCCYCEQIFRAQRDLAVEHFRPKSGARQGRKSKDSYHPGYYWLVYNWENLLVSCHECNSTYKQVLFPLSNPKRRARSHHDDIRFERPLFVHPVLQDPRDHIRFRDDLPIHRSRIGRVTIEEIGLRRPELTEARLIELKRLKFFWDVIEDARKHPRNRDLQRLAIEARQFLTSAIRPDAQFSSMAQDFLDTVAI